MPQLAQRSHGEDLAREEHQARSSKGPTIKRVATIEITGEKLAAFDIGFVADGAYHLADRSNKSVDIFDI